MEEVASGDAKEERPRPRIFAFPKQERLLKRPQFLSVQRSGRRWRAKHLIVLSSPNDVGWARFGFTVSRKVGNAVIRNRVRRRMRDIVRLARQSWPPGLDVILIARPSAAGACYADLERDFHSWLSQREGR